MFYDFIEIGTSDFDTLIGSCDPTDIGLSVEPVSYYLERLPNISNCIKINAAVADYDGEAKLFQVTPETMKKYDLPDWFRGCSSIGEKQPTVMNALQEKNLPLSLITESIIPVMKLETLFKQNNVTGVFNLKIDTEGHDVKILSKYFENPNVPIYPHEIKFETNCLSDPEKLHSLIAKLITNCYDIESSCTRGGDTILRLNIHRIKNRSRFTDPVVGYFLPNYPKGYDVYNRPHSNSLESAKKHCEKICAGGVTFQNGNFDVRDGNVLMKYKTDQTLRSWIYL